MHLKCNELFTPFSISTRDLPNLFFLYECAIKQQTICMWGWGRGYNQNGLFFQGVENNQYQPTIVEQYSRQIERYGANFRVDLLDTAGQEDYDSLLPISVKGSNAVIMGRSKFL